MGVGVQPTEEGLNAMMRFRRGSIRRFAYLASLAFAAPIVAMTTSWAGAAPPGGLPPGLQPTEVDVSDDLARRYGQPNVAVNPTNPDNLVVAALTSAFTYACKAANDPNCEFVDLAGFAAPRGLQENVPGFVTWTAFASFDRGTTWTAADVPLTPSGLPELVAGGHPTLTVGSDGSFYLAQLASRRGERCDAPPGNRCIPVTHGGIEVTKSTDGGLTWSDPVLTGTPLDHPRITSDLSTGVIYESSTGWVPGPTASGDPTTPFGPNDRWLVSSTDGVNWTTPRPFGGGVSGGNFPIPFISAARGVVAGVFRSTDPARCGAAPACIVFLTTTDAGATWSQHLLPAPTDSTLGPMVAADPSLPAHFAVALLTAADRQFLVYQTQDSGSTWSGPTVVTEDATKRKIKPWMAYSPDGVLGLAWRSNEPGPGPTFPYNVWAATSHDGGATFSPPLKLSTATSPAPDPQLDGLDCCSFIALSRQAAFVVWADWRPGEGSAFFSAIKLQAFDFPGP